jgi:hypothetical protein
VVDSEADTVAGDVEMDYTPVSPAYSPPPPSYIENDIDSGYEPEEVRLDSSVNRELLLEAIRLLQLYSRVEASRGRGRPPVRQREQQRRRLALIEENLETLR